MTATEYNQCVDDLSDGLFRFITKNLKDRDEADEQRRCTDQPNGAEAEHVQLSGDSGGDGTRAVGRAWGDECGEPVRGARDQATPRDESTAQLYDRRRRFVRCLSSLRADGVYARLTHSGSSDSLAAT